MNPQLYQETLQQWLEGGKIAEALQLSGSLLAQWPNWAAGWRVRGLCLGVAGDYPASRAALETAVGLGGGDAVAHNALGVVCRALGDLAAARGHFLNAISSQPAFAEAYNNLGGCLAMMGEPGAAVDAYRKALALRPDYAEALQGLGGALLLAGRKREARLAYLDAFRQQPTASAALAMACHLAMHCVEWDGLRDCIAALRHCVAGHGWGEVPPFLALTLPDIGRAEQLAAAQAFARRNYAGFLQAEPWVERRTRGEGKLRVGFLSADWYEHATSYLLVGVLEKLAAADLAVHVYSYGIDDGSPMRQRIVQAAPVFRDCAGFSHERIGQLIAEDRIDILVDLKGYTEGARPEIPALRPAPVVVNWLGYPGTMGERRMADYLIGDPVVTPLSHAASYSETLALMPFCYQPNDDRRSIAEPPSRSAAGLPEDAFVWCSFNLAYKITPEAMAAWAAILARTPGSVLWLLDPGAEVRQRLQAEIEAGGVAATRLIFAPKLPQAAHLARLRLADIALDTYPCNSHTTASDALWAGVPLISRVGETFAGRVAASLLQAAELPELVVDDWESYISTAVDLWASPDLRSALARRIRDNRYTCPLFDSARFARDFEYLLQRIWQHHSDGISGAIEPVSLE